MAVTDAKVSTFLAMLAIRLTTYDRLISKKHPNVYRLGLYLEAHEKVEHDVKKYLQRDDPEALQALKESISRRFTLTGMPPAALVVSKIDSFLETGVLPRLAALEEG